MWLPTWKRSPGSSRPALWWDVVLTIKRQFTQGRLSMVAGGVAFFGFLALFPALAALVASYGLLADPHDVKGQSAALAGLLPLQVRQVMEAEMAHLAARSSRTLSLEVTASILAALWAANKGTRALMVALDIAFGQQEERGVLKLNATALLFTVGGLLFGLLSVGVVVVAPLLLARFGLPGPGTRLLAWLRWPILAVLLLAGLALLYRFGPARARGRWRWVTAGSALAAVLWLISSALFSWFVATFTSFQRLDGSIAAIAVLLSWFLLSAYVVILGAEVDAALERPE